MTYATFDAPLWAKKLNNNFLDYVITAKTSNENVTHSPDVLPETLGHLQQKYFAFRVDDMAEALEKEDMFKGYCARASIAVRDVVDRYNIEQILATIEDQEKYFHYPTDNKITPSNPIIPIQNDSSFQLVKTMITSELMQFDRSVPVSATTEPTEKFLLIPAKLKTLFLRFSKFKRCTSLNQEIRQDGKIGTFYDYDVYVTTNAPKFREFSDYILVYTDQLYSLESQTTSVERVRPFNMFADAVKGLFRYSLNIKNPSHAHLLVLE